MDKENTPSNLSSYWKYTSPFISQWQIDETHIDHYQHVNNVAYLSRLEQLAWEHSSALGLQFSDYQALDRAMVIQRHELDYLAPAHLGDAIDCATWITMTDKKFRLNRAFQFVNTRTHQTVFFATTKFVCCSLSTGRPKLMPDRFINTYAGACIDIQEIVQNK